MKIVEIEVEEEKLFEAYVSFEVLKQLAEERGLNINRFIDSIEYIKELRKKAREKEKEL